MTRETSEKSQIILTLISGILTLVGSCFTAWVGLEMAKIKQGVEYNGAIGTEVKQVIQKAEEKLNANSETVEGIAQTQAVVKQQLDIDKESTQKTLDEIVDVATTNQKLINGERAVLLQQKAEALRIAANATNDPKLAAQAGDAEKAATEHIRNLHAIETKEKERKSKRLAQEQANDASSDLPSPP